MVLLLLTNVGSLMSKVDELGAVANVNKTNIICISEK